MGVGCCGESAGGRAGPQMRTRVRAMRRLSLQSESEVPLHLGLLLLLLRVGGSSENLDLGGRASGNSCLEILDKG